MENCNSETGSFALLFEFDGDVMKIRHVLYNCSASRPKIQSKANEESRELQTETLAVKARPLSNGYVKAKTGDATTVAVYEDWYKSVYIPSVGAEAETISLANFSIGEDAIKTAAGKSTAKVVTDK